MRDCLFMGLWVDCPLSSPGPVQPLFADPGPGPANSRPGPGPRSGPSPDSDPSTAV